MKKERKRVRSIAGDGLRLEGILEVGLEVPQAPYTVNYAASSPRG